MAPFSLLAEPSTFSTNKRRIMNRIEVNVETGEVTVIQFTAEEEAAALAYAASLPAPTVPPAPTLADLQDQLTSLSAKIAALSQGA